MTSQFSEISTQFLKNLCLRTKSLFFFTSSAEVLVLKELSENFVSQMVTPGLVFNHIRIVLDNLVHLEVIKLKTSSVFHQYDLVSGETPFSITRGYRNKSEKKQTALEKILAWSFQILFRVHLERYLFSKCWIIQIRLQHSLQFMTNMFSHFPLCLL